MEIDELIERIRNAAGGPEGIKMCTDADSTLFRLQAEISRLRDHLDNKTSAAKKYQEAWYDAVEICMELRAELGKVKADNAVLSAAVVTIQRSEIRDQTEIVYKMRYNSALPHDQLSDVAGIVFQGLMQEDTKLREEKADEL